MNNKVSESSIAKDLDSYIKKSALYRESDNSFEQKKKRFFKGINSYTMVNIWRNDFERGIQYFPKESWEWLMQNKILDSGIYFLETSICILIERNQYHEEIRNQISDKKISDIGRILTAFIQKGKYHNEIWKKINEFEDDGSYSLNDSINQIFTGFVRKGKYHEEIWEKITKNKELWNVENIWKIKNLLSAFVDQNKYEQKVWEEINLNKKLRDLKHISLIEPIILGLMRKEKYIKEMRENIKNNNIENEIFTTYGIRKTKKILVKFIHQGGYQQEIWNKITSNQELRVSGASGLDLIKNILLEFIIQGKHQQEVWEKINENDLLRTKKEISEYQSIIIALVKYRDCNDLIRTKIQEQKELFNSDMIGHIAPILSSFLQQGEYTKEIREIIQKAQNITESYLLITKHFIPNYEEIRTWINQGKIEENKVSKFFPKLLSGGVVSQGLINNFAIQELTTLLSAEGRLIKKIEKTGSNLFVMLSKGHLSFINEVTLESAQIRQEIHDEGSVPVAPIYKVVKRKDGKCRVYSRYCGEAMEECLLYINDKSLKTDIIQQKESIISYLTSKKINHGHTHNGNFVVECVEKDYYDKQIADRKTVNTMDYDVTKFVDVQTAIKNPEQYKFIVRLIDRDMATSKI